MEKLVSFVLRKLGLLRSSYPRVVQSLMRRQSLRGRYSTQTGEQVFGKRTQRFVWLNSFYFTQNVLIVFNFFATFENRMDVFSEHLMHHNSDRPHIYNLCGVMIFSHFWGHISNSSTVKVSSLTALNLSRQAKVDKFDGSQIVNIVYKYILRFHISVNNLVLVHIGHCRYQSSD